MSDLAAQWSAFVASAAATPWQRDRLAEVTALCRPDGAARTQGDAEDGPGVQMVWDRGPQHLSLDVADTGRMCLFWRDRTTGEHGMLDGLTAVTDEVRARIAAMGDAA